MRVVTPQTSLAVVALSEPMTRLMKELFPTPVSPTTTMLRKEGLLGMGLVMFRLLRDSRVERGPT